jgi:fimbrial chaperone protein
MPNLQTLKLLAILTCALAALAVPAGAVAGTFSVSPVRIYMQPRDRAIAITVTNEGTTELVMQAEVFLWKQKPDGADELTPTEDLILAPPILKVAPNTKQVVRLANLRPVPPGEQQTYRLIVREIPEAQSQAQANVQVQVALAFSLPVFITPPGARGQLVCQASRVNESKMLAACENRGNAYAQPVTLTLSDSQGRSLASADVRGGYVLPNVKRSFEMASGGERIPAGQAKLLVTQDDGSKQTFDVQLAE